jgi:LacI family transcriptional regulator, galactose operon repressor
MTIRNVAKAAGVSTATVSRMINDNGFVSKETKEVILRAMKSEGYQLSKFKKRRGPRPSNTAGLKYRNFTMLWTCGKEAASSTTGQGMMLGITESLQALGVNLVIDYISESNPIPQSLLNNNTDGIFLHGPPVSNEVAKLLKERSAVWLLQSGSHDYGDRVQPDHDQAALISYDYLINKGCKKLCCISLNDYRKNPEYWQTREEGFTRAARVDSDECNIININCSNLLTLSTEQKMQIAKETVEQIKAMEQIPDGIFITPSISAPIHSELVANGLIPGKNIQMVTGDDILCNPYLNLKPAIVFIPPDQLGKIAVEAMLWRIKHPKFNRMVYSIESEIITS